MAVRPDATYRPVMPSAMLTSAAAPIEPSITRPAVGSGPIRLLVGATIVTAPLIVLSLADAASLRPVWDNLHWSLTALAASFATAWSIRGTRGRVRLVRQAAAAAFALWLASNLIWALVTPTGQTAIPSLADLFVLAILVPGAILLVATVRGRITVAEEAAVYLDSGLGFVFIATVLIVLYGEVAVGLPALGGIVAIALPTAFIGFGVAVLIALTAGRYAVVPSGGTALAAGSILIGSAYLGWIAPTAVDAEAGPVPSILFTIGTLVAAFGAATWEDSHNEDPGLVGRMTYVSRVIGPTAAAVLFLALLVPFPDGIEGLVRVAVFLGGAMFVTRQALLLRERTETLAAVSTLTSENSRLVGELRAELELRAIDQRRMIQASRSAAVGDLAAGVAHEVNNPLTGVLGFAELLLDGMTEDDPLRADVMVIRDEALRARDIVRALREFASPRPPALADTDLSTLVQQTVDLVRYSIERRGITIHEDLEALPPVLIDASAIQQAVLNILTNARQAVDDGGRLEIAVRADGAGRLISITDDGIGMDAVTAKLAFDPFFSGRDDAGDVEPAAGLGLSVSNGLIESHGGRISIHSRPGRGTTVEVHLPAGGTHAIDESRGGEAA
jgi:signal transduction histidine kinase